MSLATMALIQLAARDLSGEWRHKGK